MTLLGDTTLRIIMKDKCHPACDCPHKCQKTVGLDTQTPSLSLKRSERKASKYFPSPGFVSPREFSDKNFRFYLSRGNDEIS